MDDTSRSLTFGTLLKGYRRAANLTQAELAERSGYSAVFISMLERGVRAPLAATRELLAEALHLPPHERAILEGATRHVSPPLAAPSSPLPLVGRLAELEVLEQHLASNGSPFLVLAGEPGIGKTRLLREAVRVGLSQGMSVLEGGCHRRSGEEPYAPLLAALKRFLAPRPAAQKRLDLQGCSWLVRLLPELVDEVGLAAPSWTLPPQQERRLMFEAVDRFLFNVAGPVGLLLVLDDLQWAGTDALDLLASIVRSGGGASLRVVGAYRDTEVQPPAPLPMLVADLVREGAAVRVSLGPLASPAARELLETMLEDLEGSVREEAMTQRVLQRAGGVPYFLVSCAQGLRAGVQEGRTAQSEEHLPWDVTESIRQRVAILPEKAQQFLGAAAVAGREVPRRLLLALAAQQGWGQPELLVALEAACQARLLLEQDSESYSFAHDLVREVVGGRLSGARRAALHRQIAEALEEQAGAAPVELLALHYTRAGIPEKAVLYLEKAGARARALHAHAEAEHYYRELAAELEQLGRLAEAGQALEKLGELLDTVVRYDQALEALERAVELARASGDLEGLRRALGRLAEVYGDRGMPEEGLARLRPLLTASAASEPSPGLAVVFQQLAWLYLVSDQVQEALAAAERSAQLARALRDEALLTRAEYWRGCALRELGRFEESGRVMEELLPRAQATGNLLVLAGALMALGLQSLAGGEFEPSRSYLEQALEAAEQLGDLAMVIAITCLRGQLAFSQGDWKLAREDYERAEAVVRQVGLSWAWAYPPLRLGELCLAEGRWEAASHSLEEARMRAERIKDAWNWWSAQGVLAERELLGDQAQVVWTRLESLIPDFDTQAGAVQPPDYQLALAWAALERGDQPQAEKWLAEGHRRAQSEHRQLRLVDALRIQALLCLRQERWSAARDALDEALTSCRAMRYPYGEVKALYVYGRLSAQQGEMEQARERFEAALAICARLGERLYAEQVEQALAGLARR
jgi:tetratricopeptide (TPR) repeat protein/transcriptional regulator with XRE-family HTH domain